MLRINNHCCGCYSENTWNAGIENILKTLPGVNSIIIKGTQYAVRGGIMMRIWFINEVKYIDLF
jgi:hypothetical protein